VRASAEGEERIGKSRSISMFVSDGAAGTSDSSSGCGWVDDEDDG
jgi:hypothetical protein